MVFTRENIRIQRIEFGQGFFGRFYGFEVDLPKNCAVNIAQHL